MVSKETGRHMGLKKKNHWITVTLTWTHPILPKFNTLIYFYRLLKLHWNKYKIIFLRHECIRTMQTRKKDSNYRRWKAKLTNLAGLRELNLKPRAIWLYHRTLSWRWVLPLEAEGHVQFKIRGSVEGLFKKQILTSPPSYYAARQLPLWMRVSFTLERVKPESFWTWKQGYYMKEEY